jgi:hypothetical protein
MSKRIKHNNLLPWFQEDHAQLPKAYVKSCEKFFREIGEKTLISRVEFYVNELEASSRKLQASSSKRQAATCTNKKKDIDINHE